MWTAIAFWFLVVWAAFIALIMLFNDVRKGDLVGFIVKGIELAGTILAALVIAGALT